MEQSRVRVKSRATVPTRHKVICEPSERDVHRVTEPRGKRARELTEDVEEPQKEERTSRKEERPPRIQPVHIEVPKDSKWMGRFKSAFMVIMIVAMLGILGLLLYSTLTKTSAETPKDSAPAVAAPVPKEVAVAATRIGSNRYNETVKLTVAGETTGYALVIDPTNGSSATVPLINGEGAYEVEKGAPDMNVVVFDTQGKPHSWKMSDLLEGQR